MSERLKDLAIASTVGVAIYGLTTSAFQGSTRRIIKERDGGKSVLSGETENLELAHISHDKKRSDYNSPHNGRLLTRKEHYLDHVERHDRNGLIPTANKWAIRTIWNRLTDQERDGLPRPEELP